MLVGVSGKSAHGQSQEMVGESGNAHGQSQEMVGESGNSSPRVVNNHCSENDSSPALFSTRCESCGWGSGDGKDQRRATRLMWGVSNSKS